MEQLSEFGSSIAGTQAPTAKLYRTLLSRNASVIRSSTRQEFSYGPHPRQLLDVYFAHDLNNPVDGIEANLAFSPDNNTSSPPILCFFYGGGFVKGSKRDQTAQEDLMFANVGHFYASKGFTTIIADYRLAIPDSADGSESGARFPDGGNDVNLVVEWIRKNFSDSQQKRDLFLMATSAGAAHLATFMLHHSFQETRDSVSPNNGLSTLRLRGVVYVSGFLNMVPAKVSSAPGVAAYYGPNQADWLENSPTNLLRLAAMIKRRRSLRLAFKYRFQGPPPPARTPTLALIATYDPETILSSNDEFAEAWDESKFGPLERAVIEGHNHFSATLALGTGRPKDEIWGMGVIEWMRELCDLPAQSRVDVHMPVKNEPYVSVTMQDLFKGYSALGY